MTFHKALVRSERGFAARTEFHVVRKLDGQILFGNGYDAAFFTMNHRDRRAPITLTGNGPIAKSVIDLFAAFADLGKVYGDRIARFVA